MSYWAAMKKTKDSKIVSRAGSEYRVCINKCSASFFYVKERTSEGLEQSQIDFKWVWVTSLIIYLGSIWYHTKPSDEVPYSTKF